MKNSILNSVNNTCLEASIYRLNRPKSSLERIFLGGVQTVAESFQTDNYATGFP
jgi:hypothetical protein